MRALNNLNPEGDYITTSQAAELANVSASTAKRIAEKANAVRKIGRIYRINRKVYSSYIDQNYRK